MERGKLNQLLASLKIYRYHQTQPSIYNFRNLWQVSVEMVKQARIPFTGFVRLYGDLSVGV
jgi:hypothetical protein